MMSHCVVRWANGDYDHQRNCSECQGSACVNQVHGRLTSTGDGYKEIITRKTYWAYMDDTAAKRIGNGGTLEIEESDCANPDNLEGMTDVTE